MHLHLTAAECLAWLGNTSETWKLAIVWYMRLQQVQDVLVVVMAWVHGTASCRQQRGTCTKVCTQDNGL